MTQYLTITIDAPAKYEEELTMLFFDHGAKGVAVDDPAIIMAHLLSNSWDASVFDPAQITTGRIKIVGTLSADDKGRIEAEQILVALADYDDIKIGEEDLPDIDWQKKWRESFSGHSIGQSLWVRPFWEQAAIPAGKTDLVIEPSLVFGTGDHATTAMILGMIEDYIQSGETVIDLGCGSGILATAALLLGAKQAYGIDIDPVCQNIVLRHSEINNIAKERLVFYLGDIISDIELQKNVISANSQLIMANITADIICKLCPLIKDFLAPGGVFLCSGVLNIYEEMVQAAFSLANLRVIEKRVEDDWLAYAVQVISPQQKQTSMCAVAYK